MSGMLYSVFIILFTAVQNVLVSFAMGNSVLFYVSNNTESEPHNAHKTSKCVSHNVRPQKGVSPTRVHL